MLIIGNHLVLLADHWQNVYHRISISASGSGFFFFFSSGKPGDPADEWLFLVHMKRFFLVCTGVTDHPLILNDVPHTLNGAGPAHRFDFICKKR